MARWYARNHSHEEGIQREVGQGEGQYQRLEKNMQEAATSDVVMGFPLTHSWGGPHPTSGGHKGQRPCRSSDGKGSFSPITDFPAWDRGLWYLHALNEKVQ